MTIYGDQMSPDAESSILATSLRKLTAFLVVTAALTAIEAPASITLDHGAAKGSGKDQQHNGQWALYFYISYVFFGTLQKIRHYGKRNTMKSHSYELTFGCGRFRALKAQMSHDCPGSMHVPRMSVVWLRKSWSNRVCKLCFKQRLTLDNDAHQLGLCTMARIPDPSQPVTSMWKLLQVCILCWNSMYKYIYIIILCYIYIYTYNYICVCV